MYLLIAIKYKKCGANNLNTGCDGDSELWTHTQIDSQTKCVKPKSINNSYGSSQPDAFYKNRCL